MADSGVYDWWSRHPRAMDLLYAVAFLGRERSVRGHAIDTLGPAPGEAVVELGCGAGRGFERLREGVGPDGRVVGLDASAGMVRVARERAREAGWDNVTAVRGDARRPPLPDGTFDAAYAAMSLSAVPDPAAAVRAAHDLLRPGGRLVVLDARPFQRWPLRALNAVVVPVSRLLTDWVPEVDLPDAMGEAFGNCEERDFNGGTVFVATARRGER